ncbi:hypothetical protein NLX83_02745 [Allokutzneria sp. A3M-2-11 16]|uniref:hypothetical protein n=1 Tax=Allokutzneria sp. A3M-2-11 16 TaxID=2962043 RepID=UPI0020B79850|nr:hypothetical protein [Allokutzneria sp. A3M-2-11 16]MCP3798167.1 hypothetical protein [Allokutzneria sp. A3M-2-11 16]
MFHGRFHAFCRKNDGRWRIAIDYDSDEGGAVTGETFDSGSEIDDIHGFVG